MLIYSANDFKRDGKLWSGLGFPVLFVNYETKYPKAGACLIKDREALTAFYAFYDFPAEHWVHIRTTHSIELTSTTARLRTAKTRGCESRASMLAMVSCLPKAPNVVGANGKEWKVWQN